MLTLKIVPELVSKSHQMMLLPNHNCGVSYFIEIRQIKKRKK